MPKISQETIRRVLDTADIVEVVGDYVSLRKRGANYSGLCPFHNERTPSFSVSPRLGMCKCFSCGETASAVGFVMKIEQMTFYEAIRHLAKKYGIEVVEEEVSKEQQAVYSQRESMFTLNQWALNRFENNLLNTPEGQVVGLGYFRKRGLTDAIIARFHLGYSPDNRTDLTDAALAEGFSLEYLGLTGLTIIPEDNNNRHYDRYRARVIYPIFNVAGKVVGFGGRTLSSEKKVAKYVNSPQSPIYDKSREVYGLYQAKHAISKKDRCILVEGYMDVISMHQAGIENVVASSGTSLTEGQIALIRRFTRNVTVIYDSDPAGIKASLRGIDLLLEAGMAIKVMLLPEGEDPDSFSQSHSSQEVEDYLNEHQEDFISFKIRILLEDAGQDPIARAKVINDIIASIAVIPDMIERQVYIKETANKFGIEEKAVSLQVTLVREKNAEKKARAKFIEEQNKNLPQDQPPYNQGGNYQGQMGQYDQHGNYQGQQHNPQSNYPSQGHGQPQGQGYLQGQANGQGQGQSQAPYPTEPPIEGETPSPSQPGSVAPGVNPQNSPTTTQNPSGGNYGDEPTNGTQGPAFQNPVQSQVPNNQYGSNQGYPTAPSSYPSYPPNAQGSSYPGGSQYNTQGPNQYGNDFSVAGGNGNVDVPPLELVSPVVRAAERDLMLYVLRYGMMRIADWVDQEGNTTPMTVLEYVRTELTQDEITFSDPSCRQAYEEALYLFNTSWFPDFTRAIDRAEQKRIAFIDQGREVIRQEAVDISDVAKRENQLLLDAQNLFDTELNDYAAAYICKFFLSHQNEQVRVLTEQLIADKHQLSRVHSKYNNLITEKDRLDEVVPKAVYVLKDAILGENIGKLRQQIAQESRNGADSKVIEELMRQIMELNNLKSQFAKELGERIIAPRRR